MPTEQLAAERLAVVQAHERQVRIALILAVLFPLLAFAGNWWQAHNANVNLVDAQRAGCARSTQDRYELAGAQQAISDSAKALAQEPGVPRNVYEARMNASRTGSKIADSLRSRTSPTVAGRRAFCEKAFPEPSWLP